MIQGVPGATSEGHLITFECPKIPNSTVPALCGMETLDKQNMAPLPWSNQLVKVPHGKEHLIKWPEGTEFIQCKRAKTGHMMLPIGHFDKLKKKNNPSMLAFTATSILEQQAKLETKLSQSLPQQCPYISSATNTVTVE